MSEKIKFLLFYLNLMKFDFCVVILALAGMMQGIAVTQLMEDKMCLNHLKLDEQFCSNFTSFPDSDGTQAILQATNTFKNWQFLIGSIPSLVMSVFVGYWLGNYPKYFKPFIILAFCGAILQTSLTLVNLFVFTAPWWALLFSGVPSSLSGGIFLVFSAVYTSISWGTPPHLVIVRFSVIELFVKIAMLGSSFLGGHILAQDPWISGQRKNFAGVFIVGLSLHLFGLIYTILMKPAFVYEKNVEKEKASFIQVITDVFRISRAKECALLFLKKRPDSGRLRLILLVTSGAICNAALGSEDGIAYQFAQRVYGLTEEAYTSMLTLVYIPPTIATVIGPSILKFLGLSDSSIAIFGCLSLAAFFAIRGIFLTIRGYIAGYVIGSCGRISSVAIRSLIVSTVDSAESAQIFTLSTALETFIGLGGTFLYTSIFSLTIAHQPGAVFLLVATIILYPLLVSCWIRFGQRKGDKEIDEKANVEVAMHKGDKLDDKAKVEVAMQNEEQKL
ncbi:solute carrier family 46 member 3-like [Tetranychus urticae]|uniref:Major facilitator superfamily (MFS) profile domain-containing protein n=1 Tax=Tetranychus urticae TaxID=32264 RepID=T1KKE0_TETUR|nr:solute carrier family 46 member 3-like [Tetranychus urticae]